MSEHTKGPFTAVKGRVKHREAYFIKAGNVFVGKIYGHEGQPVEENKDFFLRACNCHDDLLSACKNAMSLATDPEASAEEVCNNIDWDMMAAAIAKAERSADE